MALLSILHAIVRWAALVAGVACLLALAIGTAPLFLHGQSARYAALMAASYSVISGLVPWFVMIVLACFDFRAERWAWFAVMLAIPALALGLSVAVSWVAGET